MIEKVDKNGLKYCHFFYKEIEEKFGDFIEQEKIKKIKDQLLWFDREALNNFEEKRNKY